MTQFFRSFTFFSCITFILLLKTQKNWHFIRFSFLKLMWLICIKFINKNKWFPSSFFHLCNFYLAKYIAFYLFEHHEKFLKFWRHQSSGLRIILTVCFYLFLCYLEVIFIFLLCIKRASSFVIFILFSFVSRLYS